jgi:hypothetical protein
VSSLSLEKLKETIIVLQSGVKLNCVSCGKPLDIYQEDVSIGKGGELYHFSCHLRSIEFGKMLVRTADKKIWGEEMDE